MSEKTWGGRFTEPTDKLVESFTASISVDHRLYPYDIQGSIAHCRMLAKCGIISPADADLIVGGLEEIHAELADGRMQFEDRLEDIHMHIENRLFEKLGPIARMLHTGRSRNDQVALDTRLYLRDAVSELIRKIRRFQSAILDTAERHLDTVLPGYTHLQRAQPVLLAHHLLAYFEMMSRDCDRLQACFQRTNVLPLGAAALAGTSFPIDREYVAELLDFPTVTGNSIDTVSDRDYIIEFLAAAALCMMHLSRLSEELILWSSSEFGFVVFPDAFATGSSIMPQKKNPDVAELVRGKVGRVVGSLVNMLSLMKSLPLAYNRDMQEDKEPLFDAVDTLGACLDVYAKMIPEMMFQKSAMRTAAEKGFLNATELADYLAARGVPFREAHHIAGNAVRFAADSGKELHDLSLAELQQFSDRIESDVFSCLALEAMIDRRASIGGTATKTVSTAIADARARLMTDGIDNR